MEKLPVRLRKAEAAGLLPLHATPGPEGQPAFLLTKAARETFGINERSFPDWQIRRNALGDGSMRIWHARGLLRPAPRDGSAPDDSGIVAVTQKLSKRKTAYVNARIAVLTAEAAGASDAELAPLRGTASDAAKRARGYACEVAEPLELAELDGRARGRVDKEARSTADSEASSDGASSDGASSDGDSEDGALHAAPHPAADAPAAPSVPAQGLAAPSFTAAAASVGFGAAPATAPAPALASGSPLGMPPVGVPPGSSVSVSPSALIGSVCGVAAPVMPLAAGRVRARDADAEDDDDDGDDDSATLGAAPNTRAPSPPPPKHMRRSTSGGSASGSSSTTAYSGSALPTDAGMEQYAHSSVSLLRRMRAQTGRAPLGSASPQPSTAAPEETADLAESAAAGSTSAQCSPVATAADAGAFVRDLAATREPPAAHFVASSTSSASAPLPVPPLASEAEAEASLLAQFDLDSGTMSGTMYAELATLLAETFGDRSPSAAA